MRLQFSCWRRARWKIFLSSFLLIFSLITCSSLPLQGSHSLRSFQQDFSYSQKSRSLRFISSDISLVASTVNGNNIPTSHLRRLDPPPPQPVQKRHRTSEIGSVIATALVFILLGTAMIASFICCNRYLRRTDDIVVVLSDGNNDVESQPLNTIEKAKAIPTIASPTNSRVKLVVTEDEVQPFPENRSCTSSVDSKTSDDDHHVKTFAAEYQGGDLFAPREKACTSLSATIECTSGSDSHSHSMSR